jgi:PAS domain S-box-containing protein
MDSEFLQQHLFSHFLDQVEDYAIFAMDVEGRVISWNEGAERMKGYTEEDMIGTYYGILFTEEDQQAGEPEEELRLTKEQGKHETAAWRRKKDGSLFWAGIVLTAIYNDEEKLIGFTKVNQDLTDEKEHEDRLTYKNEQLNKTNKDLDTFIYTASHDLKAPILNIDALMQRLLRLYEKKSIRDPELDELTAHINTAVSRFKKTIEDLTTISRLQRNLDEESSEETVAVEQVYEDIMGDMAFLFEELNFPCQMKTDFQVKTIYFSRRNFRSILYNLLSNAIKFRSVAADCQIELKTFKQDKQVVLVVKDNGLGINERNQEKLFTMFKRFHAHIDGTGIGLYIIKRMIDNAGGSIEIDSTEGAGTEVRVYFNA